jgi:alanyl-tRNA synthetase
MTERLYYTDSYCTRFSAHVIEQLTWDEHPAIVLDRTAFYPTSGGQPADRGTLGGVTVLDVAMREEDGAIVHILAASLSSLPTLEGEQERSVTEAEIVGEVDWPRRFDHMQQHTGQHILSAAFERLLDADIVGGSPAVSWDGPRQHPVGACATTGFHLGTEASTIDLDVTGLDWEAIAPVEELANRIVWEDRLVNVRFVSSDELAALSIGRPPAVEGPLRIVEIGGSLLDPERSFDVNPCGGTHVARTGEIGLIKITRMEHRGNETRVEFLCGGRALRDYRVKNEMVNCLAGMLTVGYWELDQAVERLQAEAKQLRRDLRQAHARLLEMEVAELAESALVCGPYRVVWRIWEQREVEELRGLARKLAERAGIVALLIGIGERTDLCFARAEDLDLDVAALLREACVRLEGRGGGRPQAAQGSAPATDPSHIEAVMSDLLSSLAEKSKE